PGRARGPGHMAPTYFRREPGIKHSNGHVAPHMFSTSNPAGGEGDESATPNSMPDMLQQSTEPQPQPQSRQAWRLLNELRQAAEAERADEARAAFDAIAALAREHPWCGVVDAQVMALGALGGVAGHAGVPDLASLGQQVDALAEPWFAADLDGFMEVADGA